MEKFSRKFTPVYQVISDVFYGFVTILLIISAISFAQSKVSGEEPTVLGYKPIVVLTGSMEPELKTKSLIIGKTLEESEYKVLKEGDIVTFKLMDDDQWKVITHRIIKVDREHNTILTKGDNNRVEDSFNKELYPYGVPFEDIMYTIVAVHNELAPVITTLMTDKLSWGVGSIGLVGAYLLWHMVVSIFYNKEYEIVYPWRKNKYKKLKEKNEDSLNRTLSEVDEDEMRDNIYKK